MTINFFYDGCTYQWALERLSLCVSIPIFIAGKIKTNGDGINAFEFSRRRRRE